jgi:hypothetical protein
VLLQVITEAGLQETVGLVLLLARVVEADAVQPLPD